MIVYGAGVTGEVARYGWTVDRVTGTDRYLNPIVEQVVREAAPRTVLDVGCGNGALVRRLSAFTDAVGWDPDPEAVAVARKLGGTFVEDLPETRFDCVVSVEVVEHAYDPHAWAAMCRDRLAPDGLLVLTTPYHGYVKNLALALANRFDAHWHPLRTGGHVKFFSRDTITTLLEQNGLDVVGWGGVGRLPLLWKSMLVTARPI